MKRKSADPRAFTLVELLVVIAIIGILTAMILPAVQQAREAGRRSSCLNNTRNIGIGLQQYIALNKRFPGGRNYHEFKSGSKTIKTQHGWAVHLLPYIEEQALYRKYDLKFNWDDAQNHPAIQTEVGVFLCPSVPDIDTRVHYNGRDKLTEARIDYTVFKDVSKSFYSANAASIPASAKPQGNFVLGAIDDYIEIPVAKVFDGLSKTLAFTECAGRPTHYVRMGELANKGSNFSDGCNAAQSNGHMVGSGWADPYNRNTMHSMQFSGLTCFGPCVINCTNNNEAFGFHVNGISVTMTDSTSKFLADDLDHYVFAAMITRAGGEQVLVPE